MFKKRLFQSAKQASGPWTSLDPLQRIDLYAKIMDSAIPIPGTKLRLGLDPILSFIPVLGSLVGFIIGIYVLLEAWMARASLWTLVRMFGNYVIDFVLGAIPFVGPFLDIWSKAHVRNAKILREHLMQRQMQRARIANPVSLPDWLLKALLRRMRRS